MKNAWKYVRIALILTSVCLVCALGVAGVNFVTAPVIQEHENAAKLAGYKKIFPELNDKNSEIISDGFKSEVVKEKVIVKNEEGKHLGYAFNTKGKNTYGPISLIVGFDPEGKLLDLVATENGQTGGRADMINEYLKSFTPGMTPDDINNLPVYAGATFGSKLVKSLINGALSELGIKTPIQEELEAIYGEGVDMNKTLEKTSFIYAKEIKSGYTVKDSSDAVLGYYYKVNVLGVNQTVALDKDFNLKNTGATPLAVKVVTAEAKNVADEELVLELVFGQGLKTEAVEIKEEGQVKKGSKVLDASTDALLGYLFQAEGSTKVPGTDAAKISLLIALNADASYAGAYILENGQTEGRDQKITEFVGSLEGGMSGLDVLLKNPVASATKGSDLVKDLITDAIKVVTGEKPVKPAEGYNALYLAAFTGVSLEKSTKIEAFKDMTKQVKEGMILNDAEGKLLGYGYVLKSNENQYGGTLDLFVAVNADNTLNKVTVLHNGQTSGFDKPLNGYENKFTNGMTAEDVDGVDKTGATLGSNQMKELIKIALGEQDGGLAKYFVKAFDGIDLSKSEMAGPFDIKQAQVEAKITAKNAEGKVIGYGAIINLENVYSKNKMLVAFDKDMKFTKLIDIQNNHASMDDIKVDGLVGKGSIEEINAYFAELIKGGSSFSNDMARLGIIIAYEEFAGDPYVQNNSILGEALLKEIYPNMVAVHSSLDKDFASKNAGVEYKINVIGSANYKDKVAIGTAYIITVQNLHDTLRVIVGLDTNGGYVGARVLAATADDVINYQFFQSKMQQYMNTYLQTEFRAGMSANDITRVKNYHGAQYASQILKQALLIALNEANAYAPALGKINSYNNTEAYYDAIAGIDFSKSVSNMANVDAKKYPNILDSIVAKDASGNFLATAYIVYVNDIYSHNYVMVLLDANNNLLGVYDVQNDHGALEQFIPMFTPGWAPITEEDIKGLEGYINTDSSFTVEVIRRAVLTAMEANNNGNNVDLARENAARTIFPLMVNKRSINVNIINDPTKVVFAREIYGVKYYKNGQFLGYVYELAVNENLTITVAATTDGKLFAADNQVNYVINKNTTGILNKTITDFLAKFGTALDTAEKIDAVENGDFALAAEIKVALKDALAEAAHHTSKTPYDALVKNLFADYSYEASKHLDGKDEDKPHHFANSEIFYAEEVHNKDGKLLGFAYVMNIKNPYSKNTVVVGVDAEGKLVGFYDYANTHASVDLVDFKLVAGLNDIKEINKVFDELQASWAGASYTIDMARYAVRVAINEFLQGQNNEVSYEVVAKKIFPEMVGLRSIEIDKSSLKNDSIICAFNARGTKNFQDNANLGNVYVIKQSYKEGYLVIMVGIAADGTFAGAHVLDSDIANNMTHTGNLASKAEAYLEHFAGYTAKDINSVPTQAGEYYIDFLVKNIILTAFAEFNGEKVANLFDIDEAVYAEAFKNAFGVYDATKSVEVKEGFINANILRSLKAVKRNGEILGTAYIMFVENVYGRNTIAVILDNEGNFLRFVDIQNDHAAVAGNDKLFNKGMTEAEIEEIVHAGGSFTTELLKLAVLTAMSENQGKAMPRVELEVALKNLFPYIVLQRSHELDIEANEFVKLGYFVGGVSFYTTDKPLGYAYLLKINKDLEIMISVDLTNKLFPGNDFFISKTLGYMPKGYTIVKNDTNVSNSDINAFLAKFGQGIDSDAKIDEVENGEFALANDVKAALKAALAEAKRHQLLSSSDSTLRGVYPTLSDVKSVKNTPNQPEVENYVTVKDHEGNLLGSSLTVKITNCYSWHLFMVNLDKDNKLINVIDLDNFHAADGGKADISDKLAVFTKGLDLAGVEGIKFDAVTHATFTIEQIRLGVMVAMAEVMSSNDRLNNELAIRSIFDYLVWDKSKELAITDSHVKFALDVYGVNTAYWETEANHKGYAYIIEDGALKVVVALNADASAVLDVKVLAGDASVEGLAGKTLEEVKALADSSIKNLVLIAFAEGGNK